MQVRRTHFRHRFFWYIVLILIGIAGVLFSDQFSNPVMRFVVVLLSVSVPIFAGGNFLARYGNEGIERFILVGGVLLLVAGAAFSFSNAPVRLADQQLLSGDVNQAARWLGILSLMLGLLVVMFTVVRTGQAIDEIGERFRQVADHMSEGFVLSSPDGVIVLVNQRFLEMLDLTEDEVVGENANDLVVRRRVGLMAAHLNLRAKGLASEYELPWTVRGEDRQFGVSGTPIFDRHGRHMGTLATIRDVTEKNRMAKRLELSAKGLQDLVEERTKELRHSEEQFRDLLMHMNEGFLTIDSGYKIRFANNRICELLHTTPEAIRGREVFGFLDPPGRVILMDLLHMEGAGHETGLRPEVNFVAQDGTPTPMVVAVSAVREPADTGARYSLVATNISELKRMQQQLELRANELETANEELRMYGRAKDSFLSNVSHELKTPLSTIQGYVEMLESGSLGEMPPRQLNALSVMARNVSRLISLINEMIEFSRMEIRGLELNIGLFDVSKLAREAIASAQPHALAQNVNITLEIAEDFPPVWIDRGKMVQVLGILLSNAVKFSHAGGIVRVRISENGSHALSMAVQDTGIGIEPAQQLLVFDKFYQVDGSISRRYSGTGIGLSIAKNIVKAHGGAIELESEIGKGSAFTVIVPDAVFDGTLPSNRIEGLEQLRILLGLERDIFRAILRTILVRCGCRVQEARNGFDCTRLAEEIEPDLILLEDGIVTSAEATMITGLRQGIVGPDVPISIFTGQAFSKVQEACHGYPNVRLIKMPFTARDLVKHVRQVCLNEPVEPPENPRKEGRVLICEPDADLRAWLETALNRRKIAFCGVTNIEETLEAARRDAPDIVFVDVDGLPCGRERLAEMRTLPELRRCPVYVLSGLSVFEPALPEGVQGVLRKPFSIEQMAQAIRQARAGN